jgi:hypothetical protein
MTSEFDHLIEQQHEALDRFANNNPGGPVVACRDVTLGNPFEPSCGASRP